MSDRKRRALSKSSDYLDALATTLRDLGGPTTIPHELTQNADDARDATIVRFTVTDEALTVWNDGTFTDCGEDGDSCPRPKRCDLHAFRRFAGRTKASDPTTTGAFGVGFTSVYQITDAPELLYDDEHWILNEMALEDERLQPCDGQCGRTHGAPGTTFVLPWARTASPLRNALEVPPVTDRVIAELEGALLDDTRATLLFLQYVNSVEVVTPTRSYKVARDRVENGVVIRDGTTITHWITLTADFAPEAQPMIDRVAGLINPERPTTVTIALPADQRHHFRCALRDAAHSDAEWTARPCERLVLPAYRPQDSPLRDGIRLGLEPRGHHRRREWPRGFRSRPSWSARYCRVLGVSRGDCGSGQKSRARTAKPCSHLSQGAARSRPGPSRRRHD